MPNRTVARQLEIRIDYAIVMGAWRQLKEELARGPAVAAEPDSTELTMREFSEEYMRYCKVHNRRPDFKKQALVSILRILGDIRLKDFKRRHGDQFTEARLAEGVRPATVNRGLAVIKNMLNLAIEREYLEIHPLSKYRMLPEVQEALRIMTYPEYRQLIDCVAAEDIVVAVYVVLLGETGMRKCEGLRIQWDHIRTRERVVVIGKAKSGKVRSVPLSDFALEWLNRLVRFIDIPEVFVNPSTGKPWKSPRERFEKARKRAKLDWVGFHGLRHFRATQWLMHGVDVTVVKELLGHSSIQTTMRYLHYVQSQARRSVIEAQKREAQDGASSAGASGGPLEDNWRTSR
jgi:integrase